MTPATQNLQPATKSAGLLAGVMKATWNRVIVVLSDPVLVAISVFCLIGLLVTLNLIIRFPDFTAVSEQFQQYP